MWLLLFVTIAIVLYIICLKKHQYWKNKKLPFVQPTFFFGNTLPYFLDKENYHLMLKRFYDSAPGKRYIGCYEILNPVLVVRDPTAVIDVTIKDSSYFNGRYIPWFFRRNNRVNPLSLNIFTDEGNRWKVMRQKLTHVFSSNRGRKILLELALNSVQDMNFAMDNADGRIELENFCLKYLIDVVGYWIFGIKCNSFKQEDSQFVNEAGNIFNNDYKRKFLLSGIHPKLMDFLNIADFPASSSQFFVNLIRDTINYRKENNIRVGDYLDTLVDAVNENSEMDNIKEKFSELDIFGNIFLTIGAGYESTAMTLTYAFYEMSLNNEIQNRARDEIVTVLNLHKGKLDLESLNDLKYVDMILTETSRKYPGDGALFRQCTENYVIPGTSTCIEAGTVVLIPTYGFHHDPQYYPNPEQFDPERFSPENKTSIPKGAYIAFGEGQRICIGMKSAIVIMKVGIVGVLSKYKLSPCDRTPKKIAFRGGVFSLKPNDSLFVNLTKLD